MADSLNVNAKKLRAAILGIADGHAALEQGYRALAAAIEVGQDDSLEERVKALNLDERELVSLWNRLGTGNREFLAMLAGAFPPPTTFTLEDVADTFGIAPGTSRARLMNIGRSLKSMGNDFTVLWDSHWTALGENEYTWRENAHAMIAKWAEAG